MKQINLLLLAAVLLATVAGGKAQELQERLTTVRERRSAMLN